MLKNIMFGNGIKMDKLDILKEKIKKDLAINEKCLKENNAVNVAILLDMWKKYDKELLEILEMEDGILVTK